MQGGGNIDDLVAEAYRLDRKLQKKQSSGHAAPPALMQGLTGAEARELKRQYQRKIREQSRPAVPTYESLDQSNVVAKRHPNQTSYMNPLSGRLSKISLRSQEGASSNKVGNASTGNGTTLAPQISEYSLTGESSFIDSSATSIPYTGYPEQKTSRQSSEAPSRSSYHGDPTSHVDNSYKHYPRNAWQEGTSRIEDAEIRTDVPASSSRYHYSRAEEEPGYGSSQRSGYERSGNPSSREKYREQQSIGYDNPYNRYGSRNSLGSQARDRELRANPYAKDRYLSSYRDNRSEQQGYDTQRMAKDTAYAPILPSGHRYGRESDATNSRYGDPGNSRFNELASSARTQENVEPAGRRKSRGDGVASILTWDDTPSARSRTSDRQGGYGTSVRASVTCKPTAQAKSIYAYGKEDLQAAGRTSGQKGEELQRRTRKHFHRDHSLDAPFGRDSVADPYAGHGRNSRHSERSVSVLGEALGTAAAIRQKHESANTSARLGFGGNYGWEATAKSGASASSQKKSIRKEDEYTSYSNCRETDRRIQHDGGAAKAQLRQSYLDSSKYSKSRPGHPLDSSKYSRANAYPEDTRADNRNFHMYGGRSNFGLPDRGALDPSMYGEVDRKTGMIRVYKEYADQLYDAIDVEQAKNLEQSGLLAFDPVGNLSVDPRVLRILDDEFLDSQPPGLGTKAPSKISGSGYNATQASSHNHDPQFGATSPMVVKQRRMAWGNDAEAGDICRTQNQGIAQSVIDALSQAVYAQGMPLSSVFKKLSKQGRWIQMDSFASRCNTIGVSVPLNQVEAIYRKYGKKDGIGFSQFVKLLGQATGSQ